MTKPTPVPFSLNVEQSVLEDLDRRLAAVRWPDEIPRNGWKYGTDLAYLKSLVDYWRTEYDWRRHEAVINSFRQYKVKLAGIDLHFIHEEGKGSDPMPLLLSHGWPGSVVEPGIGAPMASAAPPGRVPAARMSIAA